MNTRINYQYRDADNYKVYNTHVIAGGMTIEQESRIIDSLDDCLYFIPEQVNLPAEKFGTETEADIRGLSGLDMNRLMPLLISA